jgi:AraC-like DNA-binding protein
MNPVRKQFPSTLRFPFDLVYKDTKQPQNELPDHMHDWYELVYVYSGKGTFFIDQTFYDMGAGDLFLIPGNTIHRAFPDYAAPVTSSAIFFGTGMVQHSELGDVYPLLRCFEYAKRKKSYKIETTGKERVKLSGLIDELSREHRSQAPGYRQAVLIHIQHLLLVLNRQIASDLPDNTGDSSLEPSWMRDSLLYIDKHPNAELRLSELCRRASVTPSHFSRVFKKLTGMNVTDYVTAKRIVLAQELLMKTDDNIALIAASCGFDSESYFYKMFKTVTGLTPLAYKRKRLQ